MRLKLKRLSKKKKVKTVKKRRKPSFKFPSKLLAPIGVFLKGQLKKLEKRKKIQSAVL